MRISIIIVSYNVYPFLDNCLRSVRQAMQGMAGEVWVVDNASVDRTPQLVQEHFPEVHLITNSDNKGFAYANNQALKQAIGEYVLLLNPDTVLSGDTLKVCLQFMDAHPDAGAVGVKMLDGSGRYLPESKRGLPTLWSSFMKMSGLYRLFPRSAVWNNYYQGHVGENETAKVEVLTGAFMCIQKKALDKTGLLDEDYFMYGEDIDLSYRLTKAGYAIYYLPATHIIHYKGESTKKTSLNYLLTFYQAMLIFTRKHPELRGQQLLIKIAIYLHGFTRLLRQLMSGTWPVLMDFMLLYGSFYCISRIWSVFYFHSPGYFQPAFYWFNLPLYAFLATLVMFLQGAYDRPLEQRRSWIGFFSGVVVILVVYAFLPIHLRTSRMVIGLGAVLFGISLFLTRSFLLPWKKDRMSNQGENRKAIIVGGKEESDRIKELINRSRDQIDIVGTVTPEDLPASSPSDSLGPISRLEEIIRVHQVREIIFSAQDIPFSVFTGCISKLGPALRYMLAASTTMNIVGSMNRDTEGESYGLRIHFRLSYPSVRRSKRLFDLVAAIAFCIASPILLILLPNRLQFLRNLLQVFSGRRTWVSYHPADPMRSSLPSLVQGILAPAYSTPSEESSRRLEHIDYVYARDYHWTTDLSIVTSQWRRLGQHLMTHAS